MSSQRSTPEAVERSTYVIELTYKDEDGVAVAPSTLTWSLTRPDGSVINNRDAVTLTPASTVAIVLTGADLALGSGIDNGDRHLLIEGTYNSTYGSGLALRDEYVFSIRNLVKVV